MTDRFVFHPHPGVQNVLNALSSPHGAEVVTRVVDEFASLTQVLQNTQQIGNSTLIHMPDGDNVAFLHAPKAVVAQAAYEIGIVNGFNVS